MRRSVNVSGSPTCACALASMPSAVNVSDCAGSQASVPELAGRGRTSSVSPSARAVTVRPRVKKLLMSFGLTACPRNTIGAIVAAPLFSALTAKWRSSTR